MSPEIISLYKQFAGTKYSTCLFDFYILNEIEEQYDGEELPLQKLEKMASITKECILKDESWSPISSIAWAVISNYKEITDNNMAPRAILSKYL